jgi:hypothetical protein
MGVLILLTGPICKIVRRLRNLMKTIPFLLLILVLAFAGFGTHERITAQQTAATARPAKQILVDFRADRRSVPPKISAATERRVLSKVFRKYLTDENRCNPELDTSSGADPLAAARRAGQIVPSILDMANGSFTGPLKQETLYVISVSECNASHADNFGTKRVAIFSGRQLIADMDVDFKNSIVRKIDLDGDGVDELLMTGGDMNQGILIEIAALLGFQNGRLRTIQDLGTVTEDACASGIPGSSSKASVISVGDAVPGKMPRLRIDNYEASCRRNKRWRFISTGKMQE